VIGAFDKLQKEFEEEIGKAALSEMLKAIRRLEAISAVGEGRALAYRCNNSMGQTAVD